MKTIAISEVAYERLSSWKNDECDTFSRVIEQMIPPKATFETALDAAAQLPVLSQEQEKRLLEFFENNRQPITSAWK